MHELTGFYNAINEFFNWNKDICNCETTVKLHLFRFGSGC